MAGIVSVYVLLAVIRSSFVQILHYGDFIRTIGFKIHCTEQPHHHGAHDQGPRR